MSVSVVITRVSPFGVLFIVLVLFVRGSISVRVSVRVSQPALGLVLGLVVVLVLGLKCYG